MSKNSDKKIDVVKPTRPFAWHPQGESLTQQGFKAQTDVNRIIRLRQETGIDPYQDRLEQKNYGFATSKSYFEAACAVKAAETAFQALPARVRAEFDNNPGLWIESIDRPSEGLSEAPKSLPPEDATPA